ncbi:MAG: NAD kinase [Bacteroidia bacterium]|nr:NAD kinase [Bacteroidia bacterium]
MKTKPVVKQIFLFGREFEDGFRVPFRLLLNRLHKYDVKVMIFSPLKIFIDSWNDEKYPFWGTFQTYEDLKGLQGVMFSVGGDGTFLEAVTLVRDLPIPLTGINSGRLGFLADISQDEIAVAVDSVMQNKAGLDERVLLQLDCDQPLFGDFNFALNEITVHKRDDSSMIKITAFLDGQFLNIYWADGLIVATPTGSTAYSLSVGGPLVLPDTNNFILSPIAPHNLTVRPLVYKDSMKLTLRIESRSGNLLVSADSRSAVIEDRLELTIFKAPFCIKTIRLREHNFYHTLRTKLMWGADRRN